MIVNLGTETVQTVSIPVAKRTTAKTIVPAAIRVRPIPEQKKEFDWKKLLTYGSIGLFALKLIKA